MLNSTILIGRISTNLELRYTPSNIAVCQFTLAVNRNFQNAQGQNEADFIQIVVWRQTAENLCKYQQKGSLIAVEGSIQTRNYDDKDGKKVYITEVVANNIKFLQSVKKEEPQQNSANPFNQPNDEFNPFKTSIDIDINDDLPF